MCRLNGNGGSEAKLEKKNEEEEVEMRRGAGERVETTTHGKMKSKAFTL